MGKKEDTKSIFCLLWTLSYLSLIQENAIISGSEDVKKGTCCSFLWNFCYQGENGLRVICHCQAECPASCLMASLPCTSSFSVFSSLFFSLFTPLKFFFASPQFSFLFFTWWASFHFFFSPLPQLDPSYFLLLCLIVYTPDLVMMYIIRSIRTYCSWAVFTVPDGVPYPDCELNSKWLP